jgi:hypothetical protein
MSGYRCYWCGGMVRSNEVATTFVCACVRVLAKLCVVCAVQVHSECRRLSTVCTFGKRADIILPPFCISPYQDSARPHIAWKVPSVCVSCRVVCGAHMLTVRRSEQIHPEKLPAVCQRPLLVFINPRSGGQQGELIIRGLKSLINPLQIFDLRNGGPKPGYPYHTHTHTQAHAPPHTAHAPHTAYTRTPPHATKV